MNDITDDRSQDTVARATPITSALSSVKTNRRWFLGGSALAVGGLVVAACSSDDDDTGTSGNASTDDSDATSGGSNDGGGDLAIAAGAAGLEVLAVNTYTAAADAAAAGDLGEVPPAVGEYVGTALEQHQTALDAWNTVLVDAGEPEVTEPPAELETTVNEAFAEVTDVTGVAELALMLETIAAQTYLAASPMLESPDAITLAGQLQINDMQHSAILNFVLGEYPVPDVFQPTTESALG